VGCADHHVIGKDLQGGTILEVDRAQDADHLGHRLPLVRVEEDPDHPGFPDGLWFPRRQADAAFPQFPPQEVEVVPGDEQLACLVQVATAEPVVSQLDPGRQVLVGAMVGRLVLDDVDAEGTQHQPAEGPFERADIAAGAEQPAGLARTITVVVAVAMPVARLLTVAGRPLLVTTRLFHGTTAFLEDPARTGTAACRSDTRSNLLSRR
jgi:hypothetical protein